MTNVMKYRLAAFADEAFADLDGQIRAMKMNGISLLEIRGVDGDCITDMSIAKARAIRDRLDAAGIRVWSLGSPYGKIGIDEDFEKHFDSYKHGLELCHILGVKHIRFFSFYGAYERPDDVIERLRKFTDAAIADNIVPCHENEKDIYGDTARRCLALHLALPGLRAVFDTANFIQCHQDTIEAWELLSPYVEYMHIKDALPDGSVVPAGKGIGNLHYLLERYQKEVLTVEPHLSVFDGYDKLEAHSKSRLGEYIYPDSLVAFNTAVTAVKKMIGA